VSNAEAASFQNRQTFSNDEEKAFVATKSCLRAELQLFVNPFDRVDRTHASALVHASNIKFNGLRKPGPVSPILRVRTTAQCLNRDFYKR
jgi:hypothetical protein